MVKALCWFEEGVLSLNIRRVVEALLRAFTTCGYIQMRKRWQTPAFGHVPPFALLDTVATAAFGIAPITTAEAADTILAPIEPDKVRDSTFGLCVLCGMQNNFLENFLQILLELLGTVGHLGAIIG